MGVVHKIKKLIESEKVSVEAFSKKIGISPKGVYKWTDESIKMATLLKVCEFFDKPITFFLDKSPKNYTTENKIIYASESEVAYASIDYKTKYKRAKHLEQTCQTFKRKMQPYGAAFSKQIKQALHVV